MIFGREVASSLLEHVKAGSLDQKALQESVPRMSERLAFLERFVDDMRGCSQATPAERRRERIAALASNFELPGPLFRSDVPLLIQLPHGMPGNGLARSPHV